MNCPPGNDLDVRIGRCKPKFSILLGILVLPLLCLTMNNSASAAQPSSPLETATLGGGCFWCLDAMFRTMDGVKSVVSGYAGGTKPNPTYKEVCSGNTGHAEVVQVQYDPTRLSYSKLLEAFWRAHDPTTLNRQGADVGTQYRSIILYHNEEQRRAAEESKKAQAAQWQDPVVTEIVPLKEFYPAEDYHQDYYSKNPNAGYCSVVIRPKLEKFKKYGKEAVTK